MSLLAQLFSTIDSKKRQLGGLLYDPAETIYQGIRNFGADHNGLLDTQAQAYPMLATPEQSARIATFKRTPEQARKELADAGTAQAMGAMFVGKGSKTWDALSAQKAEQMAAQGVDPRKIWKETGTWKGPDGAWRQEIPDNNALLTRNKLPTKNINGKDYESFAIADALDHGNLYKAYPDSVNISSSFKTNGGAGADYTPAIDHIAFGKNFRQGIPSAEQIAERDAANAALRAHVNNPRVKRLDSLTDKLMDNEPEFNRVFNRYGGPEIEKKTSLLANKANTIASDIREYPAGGAMFGGSGIDNPKSIALHELQHAIQQREGWARGGSPEVMPGLRQNYLDEKKFLTSTDEYQAANKRMYELLNNPEKYNKEGLPKGDYIKKVTDWFASQPVVKKVEALTPVPADSVKAYRNLAGEAEARATQARIPLGATERRALFPEDSYDVPMNQLIIRGLLGQ